MGFGEDFSPPAQGDNLQSGPQVWDAPESGSVLAGPPLSAGGLLGRGDPGAEPAGAWDREALQGGMGPKDQQVGRSLTAVFSPNPGEVPISRRIFF